MFFGCVNGPMGISLNKRNGCLRDPEHVSPHHCVMGKFLDFLWGNLYCEQSFQWHGYDSLDDGANAWRRLWGVFFCRWFYVLLMSTPPERRRYSGCKTLDKTMTEDPLFRCSRTCSRYLVDSICGCDQITYLVERRVNMFGLKCIWIRCAFPETLL